MDKQFIDHWLFVIGYWYLVSIMSEGALKFAFDLFFGIVYGILAAGFIGFLIPAAYYTAQSGTFSLLWIGSFVFLGLAIIFTIIFFVKSRL